MVSTVFGPLKLLASFLEVIKVLEIDLVDLVSTEAMLWAHLMRVVLAFVVPWVMGWHAIGVHLTRFKETYLMLWWQISQAAAIEFHPCRHQVLNRWRQLYAVAKVTPLVAHMWIQDSPLPFYSLVAPVAPKSLALVIEFPSLEVAQVAPEPKGYLDGDKIWHEPSQQELNEWREQVKSYEDFHLEHYQKWVVVLALQVGEMVVWSSMLEAVTEVTIFERVGVLWNDIEAIKHAILVSAAFLVVSTSIEEFEKLSIPTIVLEVEGEIIAIDFSAIGIQPCPRMVTIHLISDRFPRAAPLVIYSTPELRSFGFRVDGESVLYHTSKLTFREFTRALLVYGQETTFEI